jgi:hypothetical protein
VTYTIDRKAFFDRVRKAPFEGRLSSSQVAGMEAILNVAELRQTRLDFLAYMLATTFHETARSMEPIEEFGRGRGRPTVSLTRRPARPTSVVVTSS